MTPLVLVVLASVARLVPHIPNFTPVSAMALYGGARLPKRVALLLPLAAMALSDLLIDLGTGRAALSLTRIAVYGSFAAAVIAGWRLLKGRSGVWRVAGAAVACSLLFFVVTNFAVWASGDLYPGTRAGLGFCYAAALPFYRNALAGDLFWTGLLFGLEALARRRGRLRRVAGVSAGAFLLALPLRGQTPQVPPVSESVVVSAALAPAEELQTGASVTVITREQIERSGAKNVYELLRTVPGVDVVRAGGAGAVTSVFLRGANSTQALVLVDGVRVNRPDFSGYDFSALSTQDVERIEVVRGPFSALYGSDALGGVVAITTRAPQKTPTGAATLGFGNRGAHDGSLFVSGGSGPFLFSGSYRDARDQGDFANQQWQDRNGSLRLRFAPSERFGLGVEIERLDETTGIPFSGATLTPHRQTSLRETHLIVPGEWRPSNDQTLSFSLSRIVSHPTFSDPEDPSGYTFSNTYARTDGGRILDTVHLASQTISASASYERASVDLSDSFGTEIAGRRVFTWGIALEDRIELFESRLFATGGVRYDFHSAFGSHVSPRVSLAWLFAGSRGAVRASFGTAFRAPSIGELYYPFSGNPALAPERSRSLEVGVERRWGIFAADVALFRNEFRDLIQYDFVTNTNANVGRARTDGLESTLSIAPWPAVRADLTYTYLRTEDETTGLALLRRPRHNASVRISGETGPVAWGARALLVGRRADVDAVTFARTEDPSFLTVDVFLRYRVGRFAPYFRAENLTDRRYAEANGFPAPRRRYAVGTEVRF